MAPKCSPRKYRVLPSASGLPPKQQPQDSTLIQQPVVLTAQSTTLVPGIVSYHSAAAPTAPPIQPVLTAPPAAHVRFSSGEESASFCSSSAGQESPQLSVDPSLLEQPPLVKHTSEAQLKLQRIISSVRISHELPLQSLGPFKGFAIDWADLGLTTVSIMEPQGGSYSIDLEAPCLLPVVQPHFEETGRLSPSSYISLEGSQRVAAGVPEAAAHYSFAYPLPGFCDTNAIPLTDFRYCFLALGGFVYWSRSGHICGVNALTVGEGMFFEGPYALKSATLRSYLYDTGRVEEATMASLLDSRITGFCWVTPGESFKRFTVRCVDSNPRQSILTCTACFKSVHSMRT